MRPERIKIPELTWHSVDLGEDDLARESGQGMSLGRLEWLEARLRRNHDEDGAGYRAEAIEAAKKIMGELAVFIAEKEEPETGGIDE